ncbi:MAG: DegQ family serine endoprotease [Acidiferrobacteraceae bacterium]
MRKSLASSLFALTFLWTAAVHAASLPDFVKLVRKYGPAVVNISTVQKAQRIQTPFGGPGFPFNGLFKHYFGDIPPQTLNTRSLGSGFIISPDGYILTSGHVVAHAEQIIVKLTTHREYVAKLVGLDPLSDVALLKINASNLPTVEIGDSSKLEVGQWVLAIGSPFGFENSATAGIVSAKGRSLPSENYVPFIQTDVPINPGNSGGPLFNLQGQVVGINSEIYSRTGGYMGLSFATPIDLAMKIAQELKATGHVQRGWIGITIQDVSRRLAESFGMSKPYGALVSDILPHSPAATSSLRVGDVIVKYQGHTVGSSSALPPLVGLTPVGTRVKLGVLRDGKPETVWLTIGELPQSRVGGAKHKTSGAPRKRGSLGVSVGNLTADQRMQYGVPYGVLVDGIENGPALRAGIEPGDVILRIGSHRITNVATFRKAVKALPKGHPVPVLIHRGTNALFLALEVKK